MSVFTKIITGEITSYKVAENDEFIAFLDINPNAKGHTLCVPKQEINKIFEMDKDLYGRLMSFSYDVAQAIEKAVPCKRVGVAVVGLEVPHAHIHLIPIQKESDMLFSNPKLQLSSEEFVAIAKAINEAWESNQK